MPIPADLQQINDSTIQVSGLIDFDSALSYRGLGETMISSATCTKLLFDLSEAQISGNIGVSLMLCWLRHATQNGKKITFQGMPENLREIILVNGVAQILGVAEA
ncbi:MAG: STAS domain-containing protein [Pseudomonadales bacterium]|nr:STAS domain-containing protein [Pseudomonadales bacterium]